MNLFIDMNNFRLIPQSLVKLLVTSRSVFTCCIVFILCTALNGQVSSDNVISTASISAPQDFFFNKVIYNDELNALRGLSADSVKVSQLSEKISKNLRDNGFTFNRVNPVYTPTNKSIKFEILVGKNGEAIISGNNWLSDNSVLDSLSWQSGEFFNYSIFQKSASSFNSNRFVEVDTRLKPRRSKSGEIVVDANFDVEDSLPLVFKGKLANDGNAKSSGWRSTLGLEWWEPFPSADKISFSWLTDPESTSTLNSFTGQYMGSYSDDWNWALFLGYSESEYNNVLSPVSFDIVGEGFFVGFSLSHTLLETKYGPISANVGLTYLDLQNSFSFMSSPSSDNKSELSFVVPRIGIQGVLDNQDVIPGRSFWSLSVLSDAGSSDNAELKTQRPGASSGFFAGQLNLTTIQSIAKSRQLIDLYLNFESQIASDPLPSSLQKSLGGISTVRGYDEREVFGDHGFHLNTELRFGTYYTGGLGSIRPFMFSDFGYVSSEESLSGAKDSTSLNSAGAGVRCTFKPSIELSLQLGIPLKDSADTKKQDPRLHFNLDFRF